MNNLFIKKKETFDYIKNGMKTIEVRLLKGFITKLKSGMIIYMVHKTDKIKVKIVSINKYHTFDELLLNEGISNILPFNRSSPIEHGINILSDYYIDSSNYNVVAIQICKI